MALERAFRKALSNRTLVRMIGDAAQRKGSIEPLSSPDAVLRVSRVAEMCPREEIICARNEVVRNDNVSSDLAVTFAHGHGLHWVLQNALLPPTGALVGQWRCLTCALLHGDRKSVV